ncbi:hypothetical protein DPMN_102350 [Dreissena polymorpha]|uniref:Uncharacterized protein n=1 Tax=Dreissena polymorpha TaxID=45954 RepID=A0A9D4LKX8_DREPO|nr:hypothetical protein DPMN_102350 [Dreissena polymorpha]
MLCCNWTNKFVVESEAVRINRLTNTAEELLAEEQVGFRAGLGAQWNRSSSNQVLRVTIEKHVIPK